VGSTLIFTGVAASADAVVLSVQGGGAHLQFSDSNNITLNAAAIAAGFATDGMPTVAGPSAGITSIVINGNNDAGDTFTLDAAGGPLVLTGDLTVSSVTTIALNNAITTTGTGNITLTAAGTETVGAAVSASGSGNVTLTTAGAAGDLAVNAAVSTTTGAISAGAGHNLSVNAAVSSTLGGAISAAAGGNAATFIVNLYRDYFGFTPDPGTVGYWVGQLQHGRSRGFVARAIITSPGGDMMQIQYLYNIILKRNASGAELAAWEQQRPRMSLRQIALALALSPEFLNLQDAGHQQGFFTQGGISAYDPSEVPPFFFKRLGFALGTPLVALNLP
jgi:hypothetical protein